MNSFLAISKKAFQFTCTEENCRVIRCFVRHFTTIQKAVEPSIGHVMYEKNTTIPKGIDRGKDEGKKMRLDLFMLAYNKHV